MHYEGRRVDVREVARRAVRERQQLGECGERIGRRGRCGGANLGVCGIDAARFRNGGTGYAQGVGNPGKRRDAVALERTQSQRRRHQHQRGDVLGVCASEAQREEGAHRCARNGHASTRAVAQLAEFGMRGVEPLVGGGLCECGHVASVTGQQRG